MRLVHIVIIAALLVSASLSAQSTTSVQPLLDRMSAYLLQYEQHLSSVVANERFQQRVVFTRAYRNGLPVTSDVRRRLDSEIGFIRLPGGAEWLGFRDVRQINGRDVAPTARRIADAFAAAGDVMAQARAIAQASCSGRIWVDPASGTIWRVEWIYAPAIGNPSSLRVDFERNDALDMMVPVEMRETFSVIGGLNARGDGVAFYSNFRRFGTGARIVPPPRP